MSVIGHAGAGKSHFIALLYLHLNRLAYAEKDVKVAVDVDSGMSDFDIRTMADRLSKGLPLDPNPVGRIHQAVLNVEFPGLLRGKRVKLPVLDIAGEVLNAAMTILEISKGFIGDNELTQELSDNYGIEHDDVLAIYEDVFRANAYSFIFNLETELNVRPEFPGGNVRYTNFLQNLMQYRETNKISQPSGVGFIFCRYESHRAELALRLGGEVTPEKLTNLFAPFLRNEVAYRTDTEPRAFISFTEWANPPNSDGETDEERDGRFRVTIDPNTGQSLPAYPEETYQELVDWLRAL